MKKTALIISVLLLSACNTVEGIGKDVKKAGQTLEKSASDNKSR